MVSWTASEKRKDSAFFFLSLLTDKDTLLGQQISIPKSESPTIVALKGWITEVVKLQ